MNTKYDSLKRITDWINNSSSDEFMSKFYKLGDNYSGITVGEFIDSFIDNSEGDFSECDILTTGNFFFGAEAMISDSKNEQVMVSTPVSPEDTEFKSSELVDINDIRMLDDKKKCTNLYDVAEDDVYSLAEAA